MFSAIIAGLVFGLTSPIAGLLAITLIHRFYLDSTTFFEQTNWRRAAIVYLAWFTSGVYLFG